MKNNSILLVLGLVIVLGLGYMVINKTPIDEDLQSAQSTGSPLITNVQVINISASGALITWNTDTPASTQVRYHKSGVTTWTNYPTTPSDNPLTGSGVTSHSVTLTGLLANTTYNYRPKSCFNITNTTTCRALGINPALSFTTLPAGGTDTTPPTYVTNLTASAVTQSTLTLTWGPSTDASGIAGYDVYMDGSFIGAVAGTVTTFNVTGLTAATTYIFAVQPHDNAIPANYALHNPTISVTTQPANTNDTVAPNMVTGLTASSVTPTSFVLSWAAAVDPLPSSGIRNYEIYGPNKGSCSTNGSAGYCGSVTGTSMTITGLTPGTYSGTTGSFAGFTVMAYDNNSNHSAATSPRLTVLIPTGEDTTNPSAPTNLNSPSKTATTVSLAWTAATDNVGVTGYNIYVNGSSVPDNGTQMITSTSYTVTGLTQNTAYTFTAKALDGAGNVSNASNSLVVTTLSTADTQPPTAPTNLTSPTKTTTTVSLAWNASTDNVGVTGYNVYINGSSVATNGSLISGTTYTVTGLTAATAYSFTVKAKDAAGNLSAASNSLAVTTNSGADIQAPTAPTNLTSPSKTSTTISLSWGVSTDNVGVTGYNIYINGSNVATNGSLISGTTYTVTGLTASTSYTFIAKAQDAAGNLSAASNSLSVTTNAAADTTAPVTTVSAATGTWTNAPVSRTLSCTDAGSGCATSYWKFVAQGTACTALPTGYTTGTAATYSAQGQWRLCYGSSDNAGNFETPKFTEPFNIDTTAPSTVVVSGTTGASSVSLTWTTSTDALSGLANPSYEVFKNGVTYATTNATSYVISGLTGTNTFYVKAKDVATNVSTSNTASFTIVTNNTWPGTGTDVGGSLSTTYEPSGVVWSGGNLFTVSDSGILTKISPTGTILNNWVLSGDFESVTVTNVNNYVYIGVEGGSTNPQILEFNPTTGSLTGKSWSLSGMDMAANTGMEGLTWVPNGSSPYTGTSGGVFYAASQYSTAKVYVYNVDLSTSGTVSPIAGATFVPSSDGRVLNDLYYSPDTSILYVLSDGANKLLEMRTDVAHTVLNDRVLPTEGVGQEGVTLEPGCPASSTNIYIAEDTGGVGHIIHKYSGFPITCTNPDLIAPTVTISSPANGSTTSTANVTISGTASDNVGVSSVTVLVNGSPITVTGTTSWTATATLVSGANSIVATAHDAAGNYTAGTSDKTISVTYTPAPPATTITAGPSTSSITQTTALVSWSTNNASNSQVMYSTNNGGPYNLLQPAVADPALVTSHNIQLSGLTAGTSYYYKVVSSNGITSVTSNQGSFITTSGTSAWQPDHTVIVVMENKTANEITSAAAPYIVNTLRPQGRYFNNFYGVVTAALGNAHTSQTQYLHLFYGSNLGVTSNSTCLTTPQTAQNIGAELIAAGKTWAWYSESMGTSAASRAITNCSVAGNYQRKHNPAPNSIGTGVNQYDVSHNLDYSTFTSTSFASLPQVSFITPNMCDDMHDCSITTGDTWLQNNFDSYIQWAKTNNSLFVLYFDESNPSGAASDKFYTLMIGPSGHVVPNSTENATLNHYSMLRFLEDTYGSSTHAGGASSATQFSLQ